MRWLQNLLLMGLITGFVSGCGFHLRGVGEVGMMQVKSIQVVAPSGVRPDVRLALQAMLKQSGIQVVNGLADAEIQLVLTPTLYKATRTAFSGLGDTTAEYITMKQGFSATHVATERVLVTSTAETARDRQILTSALLASQRELVSIQREMAQNIVRQILVSIQRASVAEPDVGADVAVEQVVTEVNTVIPVDTESTP